MTSSKFLLGSIVLILICAAATLYFVFLGSSENQGPSEATTTAAYTASTMEVTESKPVKAIQYYFSDVSKSWDDSHTLCKGMGAHVKLAEFYTRQELLNAAKYIMQYTSGGEFWIGGIYKRDKWEWADGGLVDESLASWEGSHRRFNSSSRLGISLYDRYSVDWVSFSKETHKRYLCQH